MAYRLHNVVNTWSGRAARRAGPRIRRVFRLPGFTLRPGETREIDDEFYRCYRHLIDRRVVGGTMTLTRFGQTELGEQTMPTSTAITVDVEVGIEPADTKLVEVGDDSKPTSTEASVEVSVVSAESDRSHKPGDVLADAEGFAPADVQTVDIAPAKGGKGRSKRGRARPPKKGGR